MAKKQKGKHESDKAQRAAYKAEGRYELNRIARLERTIKKQPNNEALKKVLAKWNKEGVVYRRNRKAVLPGTMVNKRPKLRFDLTKQREWEKKQPQVKSVIWEVLKPLRDAMKPKIRVKRAKRISTSG